jgi:amino acid adenylation domain-containing protein
VWLLRTAAESPDAVAILEDGKMTSFGELLQQAARVASTFCELGVRPGDRVALVLPKTTESIVAVFASLIAGAAYVPIHPHWPKERIAMALEDCASRVVVTAADGAPRIAVRDGGGTVEWKQALSQGADFRPVMPSASDPAIILFTSGSTGCPKGVVLSHSAVSAFVKWTAQEFQIDSRDRVASPSPLGFDLSTFDIFTMALRGATCVVVPESIVWMPRFLVQYLRETRITCWYSVPSILSGMFQDGGLVDGGAPDLRLALFAGEVFASAKVAALQAALPNVVWANLYGPTETNVVTWYKVPPMFDSSEPLPIGKACPYAEVTMDSETGELLAGGESTMSGYWNRPEETARAFRDLEGKRYYRTGDRVSQGASGDYTFIGRLDRQVKRRGFRIELGEIEAVLARHGTVLEAAAVAHDSLDRGTVITAFVRSALREAASVIEIKAYCARSLPLYMMPDRVVFAESIPKGNRGKIDYPALKKLAEDASNGD